MFKTPRECALEREVDHLKSEVEILRRQVAYLEGRRGIIPFEEPEGIMSVRPTQIQDTITLSMAASLRCHIRFGSLYVVCKARTVAGGEVQASYTHPIHKVDKAEAAAAAAFLHESYVVNLARHIYEGEIK